MLKKIFFIGAYCTIATIASAQQNNADSALTNKAIAPILGFHKTNKRETDYEKSLWKFDLLGAMRKGLDVSYERKIAPKWSLNVNSVTKSNILVGTTIDNFAWSGDNYSFSQTLAVQVRYYNNLERRKRLGKNTNFSGNYFALETSGGYSISHNKYPLYSLPTDINRFEYSTSLLYGIQRKVGKRGYIDTSIGFRVEQYTGTLGSSSNSFILPSPTAKIGIGIAL